MEILLSIRNCGAKCSGAACRMPVASWLRLLRGNPAGWFARKAVAESPCRLTGAKYKNDWWSELVRVTTGTAKLGGTLSGGRVQRGEEQPALRTRTARPGRTSIRLGCFRLPMSHCSGCGNHLPCFRTLGGEGRAGQGRRGRLPGQIFKTQKRKIRAGGCSTGAGSQKLG